MSKVVLIKMQNLYSSSKYLPTVPPFFSYPNLTIQNGKNVFKYCLYFYRSYYYFCCMTLVQAAAEHIYQMCKQHSKEVQGLSSSSLKLDSVAEF